MKEAISYSLTKSTFICWVIIISKIQLCSLSKTKQQLLGPSKLDCYQVFRQKHMAIFHVCEQNNSRKHETTILLYQFTVLQARAMREGLITSWHWIMTKAFSTWSDLLTTEDYFFKDYKLKYTVSIVSKPSRLHQFNKSE